MHWTLEYILKSLIYIYVHMYTVNRYYYSIPHTLLSLQPISSPSSLYPPPPTYILSSPSNLYPILSSIYINPGYMNGLSTISSSSNKANTILSMLTILLMTQGGESKSMRGSQLNGFNWNEFILFLSANLHSSLGIILI